MIEVRKATEEEALAIAQTHANAHWQAYAPLFGSRARRLNAAALMRMWQGAIRKGDIALVAIAGDLIVGVGLARGDRIEALYVLADYRRQGIGATLLRELLAAMRARGTSEARFNVLANNAGAIAFYRAFGARQIGEGTGKDSGDLIFALATDSGQARSRSAGLAFSAEFGR